MQSRSPPAIQFPRGKAAGVQHDCSLVAQNRTRQDPWRGIGLMLCDQSKAVFLRIQRQLTLACSGLPHAVALDQGTADCQADQAMFGADGRVQSQASSRRQANPDRASMTSIAVTDFGFALALQ